MRSRYLTFKGKYLYKASYYLAQIICDVFARIDLHGYENMPDCPCVIAANHVSYLDPFAMGFFNENELCIVARDSLMKNPLAKLILTNLNAIPIKRGESGNLGVFREILKRIRSGKTLIIFPEGTRSPDGHLQKGKAGVGLIAMKTNVPVVPVRSFGFETVLPRSGELRGGNRVVMCIGKPIMPDELNFDKDDPDRAQKIVDVIMARIAAIEKPRINSL